MGDRAVGTVPPCPTCGRREVALGPRAPEPPATSAYLASPNNLEASRQLLDLIRHQVVLHDRADWRQRLRVEVEAYLAGFESAPSYAVSFMVELPGAGPRLLDQRDRVLEQHADNITRLAEAAAAADPQVRRPSELEAIGVIGGADELATRATRATAPGQVPQLKHLTVPVVAVYEAMLLAGR